MCAALFILRWLKWDAGTLNINTPHPKRQITKCCVYIVRVRVCVCVSKEIKTLTKTKQQSPNLISDMKFGAHFWDTTYWLAKSNALVLWAYDWSWNMISHTIIFIYHSHQSHHKQFLYHILASQRFLLLIW